MQRLHVLLLYSTEVLPCIKLTQESVLQPSIPLAETPAEMDGDKSRRILACAAAGMVSAPKLGGRRVMHGHCVRSPGDEGRPTKEANPFCKLDYFFEQTDIF